MATRTQPILEPIRRTENDQSIDAVTARLAGIGESAPYVVSCYLQLRPEDRENQQYLSGLRQRAAQAGSDEAVAGLPHDLRMALRRDLERILAVAERSNSLPHARGLALFASEPIDLFESVPLPRVHRTRLVVDRTPMIGELAAAAIDFGRVVVSVVDRAHARFFEVSAAGSIESEDLWEPSIRGGKFRGDRQDAPGTGERRYHNRIREEQHRHYADIVRRLEVLCRRQPTRGIVLAGPDEHTAAMIPFLPQSLRRLLLGTARLNPVTATAAEVHAAAMAAADDHEREETAAAVLAWREALGRDWAVDGPSATLRALGKGQARRVYVRRDLMTGGYRCADTGRLAVEESDCAGEGAALPIRDLADDVIEEAVRQGIELVIVADPAVGSQFDGLAALLRFRDH